MSGENRSDIDDELRAEESNALETKMKNMTPKQKEQLERLKAMYEEKINKMRFKSNLKMMAQQKAEAKRKKAKKVAKKQRKINGRKHK